MQLELQTFDLGATGRRVSLQFRASVRKVRETRAGDQGRFQRAFVPILVLAGNRIQVGQVKRLWQWWDSKQAMKTSSQCPQREAHYPRSGEGGPSEPGLEPWRGLKQEGSREEKHCRPPTFQSLAVVSHCPNPTRSHWARLPEHRAGHGTVGDEEADGKWNVLISIFRSFASIE